MGLAASGPETVTVNAPSCVLRIAIDLAPIRNRFAREKPPVPEGEWDAEGYLASRTAAYREALRALPLDLRGDLLTLSFSVDGEAAAPTVASEDAATTTFAFAAPAGEDVRLIVPIGMAAAALQELCGKLVAALRPVLMGFNEWPRFLLPEYFERHRNWRRAVHAPIQH